MMQLVTVFGSSRIGPGDVEYAAAERCGRLLAEAGFGVISGGYGGAMEAVSRGAAGAGGHVVAVTAPAVFPERSGANRWVGEERQARSITERIHLLIEPAAATIALPGSIGTFTELVSAWNVAYLAARNGGRPLPVVAVGPEWADLVGSIGPRLEVPNGLVATVGDVDAAVSEVARLLGG